MSAAPRGRSPAPARKGMGLEPLVFRSRFRGWGASPPCQGQAPAPRLSGPSPVSHCVQTKRRVSIVMASITSSPRADANPRVWRLLLRTPRARAAVGRKCARGPPGTHASLVAGRAGHALREFWREARGGPDNEIVCRLSQ